MFKIGNFYYTDSSSSFWESLFITLFGTSLGIYFAWRIFKKTIENNRNEDRIKLEDYLKNRMRFLSLLLKEVASNSRRQAEKYAEQGIEITRNPYAISMVSILASNQIHRLKSIDSQDIFEGFTFLFGDSETEIKKYTNLLHQIDFLEKSLEQILEANISNIRAIGDAQEQMRIKTDNLYSKFHNYCYPDGKPFGNIWKMYFDKFNSFIGTGELDIKKFHENFLIPLFDDVKNLQSVDPDHQANFLTVIREITTVIEHYKINNLHYAEIEALKLADELKEGLEKLENYSEDIERNL